MSLSEMKDQNSSNKGVHLSVVSNVSEGNPEAEPLLKNTVKNGTDSCESGPEIDRIENELKRSSERFRKPKKSSVSPDNSMSEVGLPIARRKKLTFENIEASTMKKGGERQEILKKVSGSARPGELTFIMGSSGAGKTTLLNILTGRNLRKIETRGDVSVNGRSMHPTEMKKLSAYVQQDDVFIEMLTVKETLHFAAKLRSPNNLTSIEREEIVDELLVMMSLKKCEKTKVGSMTEKSLSRGERKRLAFACEILTDPPILFCDEPTSGLDAFMSHQVIKSLRQLTYEGKTVICTIHQPSTSVYHMADSLILLSQGYVIYNGPAKKVDDFFEKCGYPIPKFVSSPDHFMKVISHKHHESEDEYNDRIMTILEKYRDATTHSTSSRSSKRDSELESNSFPRGWWSQFYYVMGRSITQLLREKSVIVVKFIQTTIMALVVGGVYYGLPIHRDHLLSFKGFAFLSVQLMHMLFLTPAMTIFWKDYPVVVREYQANMYCPSAYFLAKSTVDSIQYGIYPIIFGVIVVLMTNLPTDMDIMIHYFLIMILLSFNSTALSQGIASLTGNLATGFTLLPVVAIPFMVFGGFLISYDSIPLYFMPLAYLSWYKYAFEGITIAFFRNIGAIPGCEEHSDVLESCSTGPNFITSQDFAISNLWIDYLALIIWISLWKIVGVFAFSRRIRRC